VLVYPDHVMAPCLVYTGSSNIYYIMKSRLSPATVLYTAQSSNALVSDLKVNKSVIMV
jgi:hypothetical protein